MVVRDFSVVQQKEWDTVLHAIQDSDDLVIDTETTGLQPWHGDRLCGVGIAVGPEEGYYLPFRHPDDNLPLDLLSELWEVMGSANRWVGHNIKFDLAVMYQDGLQPAYDQKMADTLMAARLCSKKRFPRLSLTNQLDEWVGAGAGDYEREFKMYLRRNKWQKDYHKAPADIVGAYCVGDLLGTWKLKDIFEQYIIDTGQEKVWEQEQQVTSALWRMECVGMGYDTEYAGQKIPQLKARINNLYTEMFALAGYEFNLNSGPQLTQVMHELGIRSPVRSEKTGKDTWDSAVLLSLEHPIAGKILDIRGLEKTLGTYFEAIASWPDATVHATCKNWGTITGRCSYADPNLQNISRAVQNLEGAELDEELTSAIIAFMGARSNSGVTDSRSHGGLQMGGMIGIRSNFDNEDDLLVSVRRLFVSRPEYRLYMLDYSQMEMRVFADYVNDADLYDLLNNPEFDFHSHVARTVWQIDESNSFWSFYRTLAKSINFGLIYGIGVRKLASQIQKSVAEAKQYREDYFNRFPKARNFMQKVMEKLEYKGYVFNRFHRHYWVDSDRAYVGVNYLVQGTSADIVKNRMVAVDKYLHDYGCLSRMLVQVHDEIVFEIHESEESWLPWKLQEIMEEKQIETLLPVEISRGCPSWAIKETWDPNTETWKGK